MNSLSFFFLSLSLLPLFFCLSFGYLLLLDPSLRRRLQPILSLHVRLLFLYLYFFALFSQLL